MALPEDLLTSSLSFGPYPNVIGELSYAGAKGRIYPVNPETRRPISLLHVETGVEVVPVPVEIEIGEDATGSVGPLPRAGTGKLSPDNFAYEVVFDEPYGAHPRGKTFVLPAESPSVVDYDKLVRSERMPAVYVPIAASLQQVIDAEAAAETAQEAATAAAGAAATSATAAQVAQGAASAAADDASEAAESAATAQAETAGALQSATTSSTAATTAQGAAQAAAISSSAAQDAATAASTSATNASTKATQAADSATAAQSAAARTFTGAQVRVDDLVLTRDNGAEVVAGNVRGPQGIQGLKGDQGVKGDIGDLTPVDTTPAGATVTIAYTTPRTRVATLTANTTVNVLPTPAATGAFTCTAVLRQPSSGGPFTVTWPTALKWAGDAPAPPMPTAPNAELTVHLFWSGVAWTGYVAGPVSR